MSDDALISHQVEYLLDVRRYGDARRALGRALYAQPGDTHLLYLAALTEKRAGQSAEAQRWVAEVIARAPRHLGARQLQVELNVEARCYPEAERGVLELLRQSPQNGHLYALYARVMLHTLQLAKARVLVDEALHRAPEDGLARTLNVLLQLVEGQADASMARLEAMAAENPEAEPMGYTLLSLLESQGRHSESLRVACALRRLRPDDPELARRVAELRFANHWTMGPLNVGLGVGVALFFIVSLAAQALSLVLVILPLLAALACSWGYLPVLRLWLYRRAADVARPRGSGEPAGCTGGVAP